MRLKPSFPKLLFFTSTFWTVYRGLKDADYLAYFWLDCKPQPWPFNSLISGSYLSELFPKKKIVNCLKKQNNTQLKIFIRETEELRNNLAHGNTSNTIKNVKNEIRVLLQEYQKNSKIDD